MTRRTRQRRLLIGLSLGTLAIVVAIALLWIKDRRELGAVPAPPVQIDITIDGQPPRTLTHAGDTWSSDGRVVDMTRLTPLLELLAARHRAPGYASAEVDRDGAGLAHPAATLILSDATGRRHRLQIGGEDVSGERRYVQEGERVMLLPGWLWPLLQSGLQ